MLLLTDEARRAATLRVELRKLVEHMPLQHLELLRDAARPEVDRKVRAALDAARVALED